MNETVETIEMNDADGDSLTDAKEDKNSNGRWDKDKGETNFQDADTDDDGLSDGFESGMASPEKQPFLFGGLRLDPLNPDSDGDGLPDGLELGVKADTSGPLTLAGTVDPRTNEVVSLNLYVDGRDTNKDATFTYTDPVTHQSQTRSCFVASPADMTLTDPSDTDTNSDDVPDGEGVLIDDQGNVDFCGHHPGAGLVAHVEGSTPDFFMGNQLPAVVRPLKVGNVLDPEGSGTNLFEFVYQKGAGEVLDASSIHIDNANAFTLLPEKGIENIGGSFYMIRLKANEALQVEETASIHITTNKRSTKPMKAKAMVPEYIPTEKFYGHSPQK